VVQAHLIMDSSSVLGQRLVEWTCGSLLDVSGVTGVDPRLMLRNRGAKFHNRLFFFEISFFQAFFFSEMEVSANSIGNHTGLGLYMGSGATSQKGLESR